MNKPAYSVLTAIGADRIGIVDDIAGLVAGRGGNIEESKMAVLGGEFAAIVLVAMPEPALAGLEASLDRAQRDLGLRLELKRTSGPQGLPAQGRPYRLETVSLDTPGIVQAITALLKRHRINIEELETVTLPAPWTGAPMFRMHATLILDGGVSLARLKAELADLEGEKDWDISLRPAFPAPVE
jgi:glycine cleavage system transcriptional repressor